MRDGAPRTTGSARWRLRLAADPAALRPDGSAVPLAPRDAALLAWLALQGPTPRNRMAELLWPASPAESARNALRQRLFQLRRQFGERLVEGQAALSLGAEVAHDLADAATLLAEVAIDAPGAFETWLDQERARRRARLAQSLAQRADAAEAERDWPKALALAAELTALEPLAEEAHRRVIRLHYLAGDQAAALLAFDRCERLLKDEVGTRPSAATLALLETVQQAQPPALGAGPRAMPAALLRPPRLIGRDAECARLLGALAAGERVVVRGEAGLGKSRLLAEAVAAGDGGAPVVLAQARPGDAALPFATLARCLRALVQHAPAALARAPRDELTRLLPELGAPALPAAADEPLRLLRAVRELLSAAAEEVGALLLDDLHFIDDASAQLLHVLLGEAADGSAGTQGVATAARPLALAIATRPEPPPAARALCAAFEADGRAQRIELAPLDEPALAALVASLGLPGVDAAALAPVLHHRTGGNPLFVLETLKHAWQSERPIDARAATALRPGSVSQLIEQRLQRLSGEALALARLAAMAGPDFGIEMAEALLHTPALRLADAWHELESAQVLTGARFAHDLVYETVLAGVPGPIARHSHRALAQWLEAHAGEPERIAAHWELAGDIARSAAPLFEAGRRAGTRGFLAEGRRLLERAVAAARASGQGDLEFDALEQLALNYTLDDPGAPHDAAVERMREIASTPPQRLRARASRADLAKRRLETMDIDGLRADLAEAATLGDDQLVVDLAQHLLAALNRAGRVDEALAVAREHEALFDRFQDPLSRSEALGNEAVVLANLDRFAEADERYVKSLELLRAARAWSTAIVIMNNRSRVLRSQGRMAVLDWQLETDRLHATEGANPRAYVQSQVGASESLRDAGRYAEALVTLGRDRDRVPHVAAGLEAAWDVAEALLWLQLGQHARAAQVAQRLAAPFGAGMPGWLRSRALHARAKVAARLAGHGVEDRPDAAAFALLAEAGDAAPRDHRRSAWFEVVLQRAAWADADSGAALAEGVAEQALAHGMVGYARRAWLLACDRALDAGQLAAARRFGARAGELRRFVFDRSGTAEAVLVTGASPAWIDLVESRLAVEAGEAGAADAVAAAHARLLDAAQHQVPEAFRASFLERQPDHVRLSALAARARPR